MRNNPPRLGILALLLLIISICLSVLSILSIASSAADKRLAERFADTVKTRYELVAEGQQYLKEMNEKVDEAEVSRQFEKDGYTLDVTLIRNDNTYEVKIWKIAKIWEESSKIDDLWKGD